MLTATAGTISYAAAGTGGFRPPAGAVGYIFLPAAVGLAAGTLVSVGWGAVWNRRLPADVLRRVFAVILAVVGSAIAVESLWELRP